MTAVRLAAVIAVLICIPVHGTSAEQADPGPSVILATEEGTSDLVNVPGDGTDGLVEDCQCDTGSAAGGGFTKICTLRAAIQTHNHCGSGIGFAGAFQGMGAIKPTSQLPAIMGPVVIDGLGQQVEIDGSDCNGCTRGLEIMGTGAVTDLVVYGFAGFALVMNGGQGSLVSGSILGTDPSLAAPGGVSGVRFSGCGSCTADSNIVAGIVQFDDMGSHSGQVIDNFVGVGPMGENLGFGSIDFISGGGNHTVRGNYVASGGFHIRLFGPETGGSLIENNFVGLSPTGMGLGGNDGIELRSDFNIVRENVVSGNGGHGITVLAGAADNLISNNRIGTTADGSAALGNGVRGVMLSNSGGNNVVRDNVISANGAEGIDSNFAGDNNQFLYNLVGTDASGHNPLGNSLSGIRITTGFATVEGNLVSGNGGFGIRAEGATGGHVINGNRVGTDLSGTFSVDNFNSGILVTAPNVTVTNNLVSGNGFLGGGHGILVQSVNATNVEISHNDVGIAADGSPLGNAGRGIFITIAAHDNTIGPGNVVAHNGGDGLAVGSGTGNEIFVNSIYDNGGLGIDLGIDGPTPNDAGDGDAGANDLQNTPLLSGISVTQMLEGTLQSRSNRDYRIDVYANEACDPSGFGEGKEWVASDVVTTSGAGLADISIPFPATLGNASATATDLVTNDTSEFSPCLVHVPDAIVVNSVADASDNLDNDGVCNTGGVILREGVPEAECTLRAAIQTAHEAGAPKLLVFDIPPEQYPGDPLPIIRPTLLLPVITESLVIDGSSQPDTGTVAVSGSLAAPAPAVAGQAEGPACGASLDFLYQLEGSNAEIRDQTLYCADVAVEVTGPDNDVFRNLIADNGTGVQISGMPASGNDIFQNTIIRNGTGVKISGQAGDTIVSTNRIGTDDEGAAMGNDFGVQVLNAANNSIDDNIVAANEEIGIAIEDEGDGTQTVLNRVRGNRIGTDSLGRSGLGNGSVGVQIQNARGNTIGGGEPFEGNVISGNGDFTPDNELGGGILLQGRNTRENTVQGNYIGTTPDGLDYLGNAQYGIAFDAADANTVGGTQPGEGNVISGNARNGIHIFSNGIADGTAPDNPQGQLIQGNLIGTDRDGVRDVGNGEHGIFIEESAGNTIGGPDFASGGNLISGNDLDGVRLSQLNPFATYFQNEISGNRIGTDINDQIQFGLPNQGHGIYLGGADTLVKRNRIAHNGDSGVAVPEVEDGPPFDGHHMTMNSISFNAGLGIDLMGGNEDGFGVTANDPGDMDSGANLLTNFPVITEVEVTPSVGGLFATIRGTFDHGPNSAGPIELFKNPSCDPSNHGEGHAYFARHRRRSDGEFSAVGDGSGLEFLTATSSVRQLNRPFAHTSEFSACFESPPPPPPGSYLVINEIDAVPSGQEFVELSSGGDGGVSLTGKVLVLYDGADDLSYAAFDLDGQFTGADGFFVAGNAAVPSVGLVFDDGLLLDGPAAAALYEGDAIAFPDGTPVTTDNLIDAVVYGPAGAPDAGLLVLLQPSQPQVDEAAGGDIAGDSLQRCPDSSGGERYTDTYQAAPPTPGDENTCVVCYIEPEQTAAGEGEEVSLTATVLVNAITPMAGIDVDFDVISGPNSGDMASLVTDANGEAVFSYTGLGGAGDDAVVASGMSGGVPFFCEAGVNWLIVPIFIHGFE